MVTCSKRRAYREARHPARRYNPRHRACAKTKGASSKRADCAAESCAGNVQPMRHKSSVERGIFDRQAAAVPDEAHEENCAGTNCSGLGKKAPGCRETSAASREGGCEHVGQHHDGEQSVAISLRGWRERGRKRSTKEATRSRKPTPCGQAPGDGRPKEGAERNLGKLEKENAGRRQDRAERRKPSARISEMRSCVPGNGRG